MPFPSYSLDQEAESTIRSLTRNGIDGTLDMLASVELLVQTHEHKAQNCGANGSQDKQGTVHGECRDYLPPLVLAKFYYRLQKNSGDEAYRIPAD